MTLWCAHCRFAKALMLFKRVDEDGSGEVRYCSWSVAPGMVTHFMVCVRQVEFEEFEQVPLTCKHGGV